MSAAEGRLYDDDLDWDQQPYLADHDAIISQWQRLVAEMEENSFIEAMYSINGASL